MGVRTVAGLRSLVCYDLKSWNLAEMLDITRQDRDGKALCQDRKKEIHGRDRSSSARQISHNLPVENREGRIRVDERERLHELRDTL